MLNRNPFKNPKYITPNILYVENIVIYGIRISLSYLKSAVYISSVFIYVLYVGSCLNIFFCSRLVLKSFHLMFFSDIGRVKLEMVKGFLE